MKEVSTDREMWELGQMILLLSIAITFVLCVMCFRIING